MVVVTVEPVLTPAVLELVAVVLVDILEMVATLDQQGHIPYQDFQEVHSQETVAVVVEVIVITAAKVPVVVVEQEYMVKEHLEWLVRQETQIGILVMEEEVQQHITLV
jgi:hypothetical protein